MHFTISYLATAFYIIGVMAEILQKVCRIFDFSQRKIASAKIIALAKKAKEKTAMQLTSRLPALHDNIPL
ncbi:MAG: hypothetical protein ABFC57_13480 [Veillonellales bacterium]